LPRSLQYGQLDGALDASKETRNSLFTISGKRGSYPQLFKRGGEAGLQFVGDMEMVQELVEAESIPAEVLAANPQVCFTEDY
jgi:hypothetical protein